MPDLSNLSKHQYDEFKANGLGNSPCCSVPKHLHATACGWDNVVILYNGVVITGEPLRKIWDQLTPFPRVIVNPMKPA